MRRELTLLLLLLPALAGADELRTELGGHTKLRVVGQSYPSDSLFYDTVVSISSIQPVINIRGVDPSWLPNVAGLTGKQALQANTTFYLKKRDVASTNTDHIRVDVNGLVTWNTIFDATTGAPGEVEIQIDCYSPDGGATEPINFERNQAIP